MTHSRLIGLCAVLTLITAVAIAQSETQGRPRSINSNVNVYEKWVEEDVAYIITPEARAEFLKLSSDKDRDHFVEDFWSRRDPTPGTPENEFKEEHYRRIAYSNFHFADTRPGWKTDRGRVYIVFGPPGEISGLPARAQVEGGPKHPTEVWRYESGREFRFEDECDCGAYKLVSPLPRFLWPDDYHPDDSHIY